jgi:hypothetical protein
MIVVLIGEWIASFTIFEFIVVGLGILFSIGLFCSLIDDIITERRAKRVR